MVIYQWRQVSQLIRFKIDLFDEKFDGPEDEMQDSPPVNDTMKHSTSLKFGHIVLGAMQKPSSFKQVSAAHENDPAFSRFYSRFCQFLQNGYGSEFADLDTVLSQESKVSFHKFQLSMFII